jgi:hypothetical protein
MWASPSCEKQGVTSVHLKEAIGFHDGGNSDLPLHAAGREVLVAVEKVTAHEPQKSFIPMTLKNIRFVHQ